MLNATKTIQIKKIIFIAFWLMGTLSAININAITAKTNMQIANIFMTFFV